MKTTRKDTRLRPAAGRGLSLAPRAIESSFLPAGQGTAWIRTFYEDYLLNAIEPLGSGSRFPEWLSGSYFLPLAREPFAFARTYNAGDCANFNSLIAAILCPAVAVETEKILCDFVERFGFVLPHMVPGTDDSTLLLDYCGINWPPSCYVDIWNWVDDRELLARFASSCDVWARWLLVNRDRDGDGWLEPGVNGSVASTQEYRERGRKANPEIALRSPDYWDHVCVHHPETSAFQAAVYELSTDDYPIYVGGRHKGLRFDPRTNSLDVHYIDTQLFMAFLAAFVARSYRSLGRDADAAFFDQTASRCRDMVGSRCWDTHSGFYYDIDGSSGALRTQVKSVAAFLPMVLGIPTVHQAERMVAHLTDPREFWTPYPVPSISVDSPDFLPFGYWSGRSWPPFNFLVFRGLLNYGFFDVADELLSRWIEHTRTCLEKTGVKESSIRNQGLAIYDARGTRFPGVEWIVPENWNCMTGEVHGSGGYTWGGLWIPAVIMRNFWPVGRNRALVRPGGHLRLEWADRWSVEVDGTRATINGKRIEMEPGVTWLFDGETGTATPCEPGRADSWVV